ncbi:MAG: PDZ domain-containing protein [Acidobacteria bacterium]|nr:PDZ domain-containing protein [Acidobacteriota bacterium]
MMKNSAQFARRSFCLALLALLSLLTVARADGGAARLTQAGVSGLQISYELGMSRPTTRLYEVTMTVANLTGPQLQLQFPVWVPGAYRVVDSARNVQEFRAATTGGQPLPAFKTLTNEWTIETRGNSAVRVTYKVFANEIGVVGMHLDDTHAYFNGSLLFPYVVGAKERPVTLTLTKPPRWTTVSTGLDPLPGKPNTFAAPDYDTFADAPFEIGNHSVQTFYYKGARFEIAIYGNHNYDPEQFRREHEALVRSQVDMMGGAAPFNRYVFIYHMLPDGRGGLEHLNSTVINRRKWAGNTEEGWDSLRGVASHEFFHLWNVKRLRPGVLGPFDYTRQVPTRDLYVSEGMTSYYGDLHILRSGIWKPERYLKAIAEQVKTLQNLPARRILTVEESSINTWFTHDDAAAANANFSYYNKGELLGVLLDLEIRQRTKNARTLDDVFRYLNENFGLPKAGWPVGGFQQAVETVAGSEFDEFFTRYVSGTEELPYERALGYAGLRLERKEAAPFDPGVKFTAGTPATAVGLPITSVLSESPAYNVLANGDILLAVGGERVTEATLSAQLARFKAGERVPLTVFRGDRLLELTMTMTARPTVSFEIVEDPKATPEQKAVRQSWYTGRKQG